MNKLAKRSIEMLDHHDRAILRLVQVDNQLTHHKLGEEVGLSTSAVRRRLAQLRDDGIIAQDVSILSKNDVGVTLIVQIAFGQDSAAGYAEFDEKMATLPNVKQSYHVAGSTDYVLIVQGSNLAWYENWAKENLMLNINIRRHDTSVVWSCKKFETSAEI